MAQVNRLCKQARQFYDREEGRHGRKRASEEKERDAGAPSMGEEERTLDSRRRGMGETRWVAANEEKRERDARQRKKGSDKSAPSAGDITEDSGKMLVSIRRPEEHAPELTAAVHSPRKQELHYVRMRLHDGLGVQSESRIGWGTAMRQFSCSPGKEKGEKTVRDGDTAEDERSPTAVTQGNRGGMGVHIVERRNINGMVTHFVNDPTLSRRPLPSYITLPIFEAGYWLDHFRGILKS
ncbi:hypothetical protein DFH06DRAFT_1130445 [Mycena polygramma]|nr:hypothetical protein DFH06DRAFT_1130445 [Mycena polygramma]